MSDRARERGAALPLAGSTYFSSYPTLALCPIRRSGTNDYSNGGSAELDAEFTSAYLDFMYNITKRW